MGRSRTYLISFHSYYSGHNELELVQPGAMRQATNGHAPMQVIGIVGGVASGKSLAAKYFQQLGAILLDADAAGHEVLTQPEVMELARERWGEKIFDAQGSIDRSTLAEIVFGQSDTSGQELEYLEKLSHPRIAEILRRQIDEAAARPDVAAVVLDAAVLLKAGWDKLCDTILFIDVPRSTRRARAASRGWSDQQFVQREAAQQPLDQKRAHADVTIDNSGTPDELYEQIKNFWDSNRTSFLSN